VILVQPHYVYIIIFFYSYFTSGKAPCSPPTPSTMIPTNLSNCDTPFVDGKCYSLVNTPLSWTEAQKNCESQGGSLATISNEIQDQHVFNLHFDDYFEYFWIGIEKKNENWRWISGSDPFSYTNWHKNRPTKNACGVIGRSSNLWNDQDCTNSYLSSTVSQSLLNFSHHSSL